MSIYEVTNLDTGNVAIVEATSVWDPQDYFPRVKVAALDPTENIQVVYYLNGKYHNDHGPALVCANGHKEWFINGTRKTNYQFKEYLDG